MLFKPIVTALVGTSLMSLNKRELSLIVCSSNNFKKFVNLINSSEGEKIVYIYGNNDDCLYETYSIDNAVIKAIPAKIYETYKEIVAFLKRGE